MTIYEIKLSPFGSTAGGKVFTTQDWPNNVTLIQGGKKGVVLGSGNTPNYTTAFVEVFIDNIFVRGEGKTVDEAEVEAYKKFIRYTTCEEHIFEPRKYTNGGGICKMCGQFASDVFTGEQLKQYCDICGEGTTHNFTERIVDNNITDPVWLCKAHSEGTYEELYTFLVNSPKPLTQKLQHKLYWLEFILDKD